MKLKFSEIFIYSFKLFSCIATFVLIPLSFIYNVDAFLATSYPFDIVCDLSIAYIALVLLSIFGSFFIFLSSLLASLLIKNKNSKSLYILINAVAIIIVVEYTINYLNRWLGIVINIQLQFVVWSLIKLLISLTLIGILIGYTTFAATQKRINQLFIGVIVTIIASSVILSIKGATYIAANNNYFNKNKSIVSTNTGIDNRPIGANNAGEYNGLPNIILVTFDALTAEDMSLYRYPINTTPHIDELAKKSYVFDNIIANSNWTRPAAASIITGKYPNTLKIFDDYNSAEKRLYNHENLARVLREKGYQTAAVTSNICTHPLQNMTYSDFDYLPDTIINNANLPPIKRIISLVPSSSNIYKTSSVLLNDILSPLDRILNILFVNCISETPYPPELTFENSLKFILNTKPPFFIWIHIMPPHAPYFESKSFKYRLLEEKIFDDNSDLKAPFLVIGRRYQPYQQSLVDKLRLRYDENIMYADDEFGKFLKSLSKTNILENSILIVSSDHGQSFRKGYLEHGGVILENLYQSFIWIPLIIHIPKTEFSRRVKSNGEQVDIAPTVLDLLNIQVPGWMEGESLKGAMFFNELTNKPKYSMSLSGKTGNGRGGKGAIAVIRDDYKYIFQIDEDRGELYNIKNDQYETNNLVNAEKHLAAKLKELALKKMIHDGGNNH